MHGGEQSDGGEDEASERADAAEAARAEHDCGAVGERVLFADRGQGGGECEITE